MSSLEVWHLGGVFAAERTVVVVVLVAVVVVVLVAVVVVVLPVAFAAALLQPARAKAIAAIPIKVGPLRIIAAGYVGSSQSGTRRNVRARPSTKNTAPAPTHTPPIASLG